LVISASGRQAGALRQETRGRKRNLKSRAAQTHRSARCAPCTCAARAPASPPAPCCSTQARAGANTRAGLSRRPRHMAANLQGRAAGRCPIRSRSCCTHTNPHTHPSSIHTGQLWPCAASRGPCQACGARPSLQSQPATPRGGALAVFAPEPLGYQRGGAPLSLRAPLCTLRPAHSPASFRRAQSRLLRRLLM
jgi:hypothetical protein